MKYFNTLKTKLTHSDFFTRIITRVTGTQALIDKKNEKISNIFTVGGILTTILGEGSILYYLSKSSGLFELCFLGLLTSMALAMGVGIVYGILASTIISYTTKNEELHKRELKKIFFDDIKNHPEYFKDLSLLILDKDGQDIFDKLVDMVIKNKDEDAYDSFLKLLEKYEASSAEKKFSDARQLFLKQIDASNEIKDENTKEGYLL